MPRPIFLEPRGTLTHALLHDALGLVLDPPPPLVALQPLTRYELDILYDWAMREHLAASDNGTRRRPKPHLLTLLQPNTQREKNARAAEEEGDWETAAAIRQGR